jgi:hypothetical protein
MKDELKEDVNQKNHMNDSELRMIVESVAFLFAGFFFMFSAALKDISEDMRWFFIVGSVVGFIAGGAMLVRLYKSMEK